MDITKQVVGGKRRSLVVLLILLIGICYLSQIGIVPLDRAGAVDNSGLAPVAISENGKYLISNDGVPFFWMGDTAWDMHHRLTREEIELYLDDRQQKGINVILFRIPFKDLEGEPQRTNPYGDVPFVDKDITQPSENFFELVDFSLTEMEKRGMTAGILPLWGFVVAGKDGFNVSDNDVRYYAQWLSNRYRDRKNIIWITGGDTGKDDKWEILGRELKTADPEKLVTFHPGRWVTSSYHVWGDTDWLDFHMTQTGHSPDLATNYQTINEVYEYSSKPILNGEPAYEDIGVKIANQDSFKMPPHQIRKAAYWSLLAGGFGHVYGHVEIFQFAGAMPGQPYTYGADEYWMDILNAPGTVQISYLSAFLRNIPWHTFVPKQSLISSSNPSGPAHIRAAMSANQAMSLIYFPEQRTATIRLSELAGPLNVRWFNPESGESEVVGMVPASGNMSFSSPFPLDSLLILEPAGGVTPTSTPGSSTPTSTPIVASMTPTATSTVDSPCLPQAGELLSNGHFEAGTEDWRFSTGGRGSFSAASPAYACDLAAQVTIKEVGKNMQFYQYGVPLKAGTTYRLSFFAYSTSGSDVTAEFLKHSSPYTNYGLSQQFDLGEGWQFHSVEFTAGNFEGMIGDGRFRFRLHGKNNESYWFDAVSLVEVGSGPATATPTPTATDTATATDPATATPTPTATAEAATATATPDVTATSTPTNTPTSTPTNTPTATATADAISSCLPQPGELLLDGSFEEGTGYWHFHTTGRGSFVTSAPAYACDLAARIQIKERGRIMQFYQYGISLKANTKYRLTFAAYSASANDLAAELLKHSSPYSNYGLVQQFDLGTGWQSFSVEFTTSGFSGTVDDGRLRFRLYGKNNDTYWFDAISLQEVGPVE